MSSGASARKAVQAVTSHSSVVERSNKMSAISAVLSAITAEGDALLFSCRAEKSSAESFQGVFSEVGHRPLENTYGTFAKTLSLKPGSVVIVELDRQAAVKFGFGSSVTGFLALTCLQSRDGETLCAGIFQSSRFGNFQPHQIQGLKAAVKIMNPASDSSPPSIELQGTEAIDLKRELVGSPGTELEFAL